MISKTIKRLIIFLKSKNGGLETAIVFCKENIISDGKITYFPWYLSMFFQQESLTSDLKVDLDVANV